MAAVGNIVSNRVVEYSEHWERMYEGSSQNEWHATWDDIKLVLLPYLQQAATYSQNIQECHKEKYINNNLSQRPRPGQHKPGCVIDVGCGASTLGLQLFCEQPGFANLLLIDAAPALLHKLQQRPGNGLNTNLQQNHTATAAARAVSAQLLASDCRRLPFEDGCAAVVLDKGTMDALWSDQDKIAMLRECARVAQKPHGIIVSISFSSPARLNLLQEHCPGLGLKIHTHVIGKGDPAKGCEVRFLTVLAQDFDQVPYTPSDLTTLVLKRIRLTGSLLDNSYDDCDDDTACDTTSAYVGNQQVNLPSLFD